MLHILLNLTPNIHQNHFLGHKAHFNKYKRMETIQRLLLGHSRIKLEIINKKIAGKPQILRD